MQDLFDFLILIAFLSALFGVGAFFAEWLALEKENTPQIKPQARKTLKERKTND